MNFKPKKTYSYEDLIECGNGNLFGEGNAQLPLPNMLMISRITEISETGGKYNKGYIEAEFDIEPNLWFFKCHFKGDSVMPGCLGLDAIWQLIGFHLAWRGGKGKGRALGVGNLKFTGQVLPEHKKTTYKIHMSRIIQRNLFLGLADAIMEVDGKPIYKAEQLKVGLFID